MFWSVWPNYEDCWRLDVHLPALKIDCPIVQYQNYTLPNPQSQAEKLGEREWCTEASVWLLFNLWLCAQSLIPQLKHGPMDFTDHNHITLLLPCGARCIFFSDISCDGYLSFLVTQYLNTLPIWREFAIKKLKGREIAPFPRTICSYLRPWLWSNTEINGSLESFPEVIEEVQWQLQCPMAAMPMTEVIGYWPDSSCALIFRYLISLALVDVPNLILQLFHQFCELPNVHSIHLF